MQAQRQVVSVLRANQTAPERLAELFQQHMAVLEMDADAHASALMERDPPLTLDDFQDTLHGYHAKAEEARLMCCNTVRTGIYTCDPLGTC